MAQVNRRGAMGSIAAGLTSSGAIWEAFAQTGIRVLHSPDDLARAYDYLIVGAGSAGCVLACRLAQAKRSVLLIEAGGPATLPAIPVPPDWPLLQGSSADWRYVTVPQRHLGDRIIPCPRGKVVGGSSAINALAYQRGHRAAFDRWPEGWRFGLPTDLKEEGALAAAILGFELGELELEAKFKLGQNRSAADRAGVRRGLAARADAGSAGILGLMRDFEI